MIRARVEPELKHAAEAVLKELGLTPTEAIILFYKQVTLHRGLPFAVELLTAETARLCATRWLAGTSRNGRMLRL